MSTGSYYGKRELLDTIETLEKTAQELRRKLEAVEKRARFAQDFAADQARFRQAGFDALALVNDGYDQAIACARAAAKHGLTFPWAPDTVAHHMKTAKAANHEQARAERNRRILQMARKGWTNAEIADQIGCSTRTVSRAIAAAFRQGTPARP